MFCLNITNCCNNNRYT
uniref:Uncharacterized protein n=1 Tax=Medicago truncatula TaxID=3880 RepID=I3T2Y9_MEDTR|nr:unknown [Medicago truncatula]